MSFEVGNGFVINNSKFSILEQVCDRQHRHEHSRGRDHDPKYLYHALSAHLLLPNGSC